MSLRYRNVLPLAVVCLALVAAPALAAEKAAPTVTPILGNAPAPDGSITAQNCEVGQNDTPTWQAQFVFPPNDEYHTLLLPTSACCPTGGSTMLTMAHALLFWPSNCTIPVSVSILGATGDPGCPVPDPNNVICAPTTYIIDGAAGGVIQHDFALPAGCCISGPAFLKIDFVNNGSCPPNPSGLDAPRLVGDSSPNPCTSYNFYPGNPTFVDMLAYGFPGNPNMWADGDCCTPTPTLPSTWGSVKSLYR